MSAARSALPEVGDAGVRNAHAEALRQVFGRGGVAFDEDGIMSAFERLRDSTKATPIGPPPTMIRRRR